MRETPIDPRKVRGKFVGEKKNTDIDADPIDNPPEKSSRKDVPKEKAEMVVPEKGVRSVNITAIWLAVILMVGAWFAPRLVPVPGLASLVTVVMAFVALVFTLKDPHLLQKKFPRLGVNPLWLMMIVCCVIIVLGLWGFVQYLFNPHG